MAKWFKRMLWRWLYESREEGCVSSVTPVTSSLGRGNLDHIITLEALKR